MAQLLCYMIKYHEPMSVSNQPQLFRPVYPLHLRFQSLAATSAPAVPKAVANSQYPDFLGVVGLMVLRVDNILLTKVGCGNIATAVYC